MWPFSRPIKKFDEKEYLKLLALQKLREIETRDHLYENENLKKPILISPSREEILENYNELRNLFKLAYRDAKENKNPLILSKLTGHRKILTNKIEEYLENHSKFESLIKEIFEMLEAVRTIHNNVNRKELEERKIFENIIRVYRVFIDRRYGIKQSLTHEELSKEFQGKMVRKDLETKAISFSSQISDLLYMTEKRINQGVLNNLLEELRGIIEES